MPESSPKAALTAAQARIWRTYRSTCTVVALVNGVYIAYAFIYLKHRLQSAGGASDNILDNLLFVIVASMFFEFFAEPITGDWADSYGRRRMVIASFVGVGASFVAYWSISAGAVSSLSPRAEVRTIVAISLAAEVLFAVASALFNGAMDAWFVDELGLEGGPQGAALLPYFAAQRRRAGLFMVGGGVLSLWLANVAFQGDPAAQAEPGLWSLPALPWVAATATTAAATVWLLVGMREHRKGVRGQEPSHLRIWLRLKRTLRARELRHALLISSLLYTCWVTFMFLLPVLLTERAIVGQAGVFASVLKNYYWYYLAMGSSRFLGPYLAGRLGSGTTPGQQFRWWGVVNCGGLSLAGVALLCRGHAGAAIDSLLVPLALALFWVTKVGEEAFKPVRSTYLNALVVDGADRAFVLSMATPFGAVIIVAGVALLAVTQHFVAAMNEISRSVPLLFAILGAFGLVVTVRLSRRAGAGA
jgi:MFS family permease